MHETIYLIAEREWNAEEQFEQVADFVAQIFKSNKSGTIIDECTKNSCSNQLVLKRLV
jgi:hypothetical protein